MHSSSFEEWVGRLIGQPLSPAQIEYIRKTDPAFYYNYIQTGKHMTDKKRIQPEDVTRRGSYIPYLSGRPDRHAVINSDDVLNLTILLNTTESFDAFLAAI